VKYLVMVAGSIIVARTEPGLAAVAGLVIAVAYAYSLRRRPMRPCRPCGGSGANRGRFWKYAYGDCWCCHGAKGHVRLGVRVFQRSRARQLSR